ncbi:putative Phosphoribosylaminoimidazole carboxylase [Calycina marina]|uniref:Phosphoribosylaminoimidazole carboxylase n=1 Tax=Calycina marina TaxID=1763456 RepID=A0A9P7Z9P7_9HELO|nr:putative Phosphoribosylaminoimidazole carboxylase [Calycina marina]
MDRTIGLLGGGQLGRMLVREADQFGIRVVILDAENSPAKQISGTLEPKHINGSFTDPKKIRELARQVDVLTVEIEHVDTEVLEEISERGVEVTGNDGKKSMKRVEVQPSWKTIRIIQDKFLQKGHLEKNGVPTAVSESLESTEEALSIFGEKYGFPYMLKARKDAYDGRGNYPVRSASDIPEALNTLQSRALYAEKWATFKKELAVMVVKTSDSPGVDATTAYPTVETIHEDSICKLVYAPARGTSTRLQKQAQDIARKAVGSLWGKGVFGVELFLMDDDSLVVNEIAPRPHNSGHYTIEACAGISQYRAQLLSILGIMPSFPSHTISADFPATIMLNILGGATKPAHNELLRQTIATPKASLHLYGKESKPARKIGHITIKASSMREAENIIAPLIKTVDGIRAERTDSSPVNSPISSPQKLVLVTMGSDSDLPVLAPGLALLKELNIPYQETITSAHRTPKRMIEYAENAASNGFKVIIAAAGGAAHLPGMIASSTTLPVIGVPVKASTLDGVDSLYSIVQMPRGVPVAAVAINNSINAALLAARILATSDPVLFERLEKYAQDMEDGVIVKAERLEEIGFEAYGKK